jgi:hypothetical protein
MKPAETAVAREPLYKHALGNSSLATRDSGDCDLTQQYESGVLCAVRAGS